MSRPIEIDETVIEKLAGYGLKYVDIAEIHGCDPKTIKDKYQAPYERGRANMRQKLRQKQLEEAENGNSALLIWLGKQYLGQSDKLSEDSTTAKITVNIGGNRDKPEIKAED